MERKWEMKNVDLNLLATKLVDFFKEKEFNVKARETAIKHQVLAENSSRYKLIGYVDATVEGKPNDFVIRLELWERRRYSGYGSFFLSMFGGGYLLRQEAESDEAWMKLEKEFWQHAENTVLHLTNTAKLSNDDLKIDT